jgi:hypothetical protein
MAIEHVPRRTSLSVRDDEPLIGIPSIDSEGGVTHFFATDEDAAQARDPGPMGVDEVLDLIGAWAHIDAEGGADMLDELDRIRRGSPPVPRLAGFGITPPH